MAHRWLEDATGTATYSVAVASDEDCEWNVPMVRFVDEHAPYSCSMILPADARRIALALLAAAEEAEGDA